jgi:aminoglycoside phosphotransferase (APT) family kinase protein
MASNMPRAEVVLEPADVRMLLQEQHPDLASLPLSVLANGWDNVLMRLGEELLVRLPRREMAAQLVAHEQRWLPMIAPDLPLPVPVPVRVGHPSRRYPWPWSITRYLPGDIAATSPPANGQSAARALGSFLAALHRPAPAEAPANPFRGVPLQQRDESFRANLERAGASVDTARCLASWSAALAAEPWPHPPVWLHGDLHPANILVDAGQVSAIVDFGDITSGDPATDLAIAWMMLPTGDHAAFWNAYAAGAPHPVDPALQVRASGWALVLGMVFVAHSADNAVMLRIGKRTTDAVLATIAQ